MTELNFNGKKQNQKKAEHWKPVHLGYQTVIMPVKNECHLSFTQSTENIKVIN